MKFVIVEPSPLPIIIPNGPKYLPQIRIIRIIIITGRISRWLNPRSFDCRLTGYSKRSMEWETCKTKCILATLSTTFRREIPWHWLWEIEVSTCPIRVTMRTWSTLTGDFQLSYFIVTPWRESFIFPLHNNMSFFQVFRNFLPNEFSMGNITHGGANLPPKLVDLGGLGVPWSPRDPGFRGFKSGWWIFSGRKNPEHKSSGRDLRGDCKPYPHNVKLVNV